MIELLSPVGNFECLKAAVQNGANAVYFGANTFSARAFATNFDLETLEDAINYAKLRNVKTNLTLNTLIKDNEFKQAFELAKKAYEFGIDAIIIQDLGLANQLLKAFPDITLHASTQMTVHNLEGVKQLEKLGFKRVVLSRELSINEIEHICKNTNIEIEVFVHGALCISYSGQCLFSSMVGGRSGNRGKCAQPCRLPYKLYENEKIIDKGYLLSTRDLCGLDKLSELVNAGVNCLKIEGRMKSPEYVATVTNIYRKYLDRLSSSTTFNIEDNDKKDLMQVFNRGGFSTGHLNNLPNTNLVFKEKPNNMGIYIGEVSQYNPNKGLITCTLKDNISLGDTISLERENTKYKISELMLKNNNVKSANSNQTITFGRMKGNIHKRDKIFKIASKELTNRALNSFNREYKKIGLYCKLQFKNNKPIYIEVCDENNNISTNFIYDYIPQASENKPLNKDSILKQFYKTNDTSFEFLNIDINLDDNLFIPISILNDLRRTTLSKIESKIIKSFKREVNGVYNVISTFDSNLAPQKEVSLLLNELNNQFNYSKLKNVDKIYIPLKYFYIDSFKNRISEFSKNNNIYIYLPFIIKNSRYDYINSTIKDIIKRFNINGFIISNLSQLNMLKNFKNLEIIANYNLNVFNNYAKDFLNSLSVSKITISPELDKYSIQNLCNSITKTELIVYGKTPLMISNYCLLGNSNKCHNTCNKKCLLDKKYFIEDRLGLKFRIIPDNYETTTTIYNSKTTSISSNDFNVNSIRIDVLDEDIKQINNIIENSINGNRFEGKNFTNGNLKKDI